MSHLYYISVKPIILEKRVFSYVRSMKKTHYLNEKRECVIDCYIEATNLSTIPINGLALVRE